MGRSDRRAPSARSRRAAGFTLIEVMIAVAIVAVLLSLAVPAYDEFLKQSRRHDGRTLLQLNAQRLQRCFTLAGKYDKKDAGGAHSCVLRTSSEEGYYTLVETTRTATAYTLSAVPVAGTSQENDDCGTFTYEHTGATGASGGTVDDCW